VSPILSASRGSVFGPVRGDKSLKDWIDFSHLPKNLAPIVHFRTRVPYSVSSAVISDMNGKNDTTLDKQRGVDPDSLLRLRQVLNLIPVAASTWWSGVRSGRFPKPLKLGPRTTCWRARDVLALIDQVGDAGKNGR